jgi:hypothetical protein
MDHPTTPAGAGPGHAPLPPWTTGGNPLTDAVPTIGAQA